MSDTSKEAAERPVKPSDADRATLPPHIAEYLEYLEAVEAERDALRALVAEGVKAGLEMGADGADKLRLHFSNSIPATEMTDVDTCVVLAHSFRARATDPAVIDAAVTRIVEGGD